MMRTRSGLAVGAALLATGCHVWMIGGFRAGEDPAHAPWPPEADGPPRRAAVTVAVRGSQDEREFMSGWRYVVPFTSANGRWSWSDETRAVLRESGLFTLVDDEESAERRLLVVAAWRHVEVAWGLAVFSLVVPIHLTDEVVSVTLTVSDADGEELGSVSAQQTLENWAHLLMPLLYPFVGNSTVATRDLYRDLLRAAILDARSRGLLGRDGAAPAGP